MTPRRGIVLALTLVLAALLAIGAWGQAQTAPTIADDDAIAIAISQPQVFHPTPGGGTRVSGQVVQRAGSSVVVEVVSDGQRYRVTIDSRTRQVTDVSKE